MNLDSLEFFYCHYVGRTPELPAEVHNTTQAMIHHLFDSKLWLETIMKVYEECAAAGYISPSNIPRYIWKENNLIDYNCVYIHKELVLRAPAPYFDNKKEKLVSYPYYFENIEYYSLDNLLDYVYNQFKIDISLQDRKRDKGLLQYYLKKYHGIPAPTLDYILFLIDNNTALMQRPTLQSLNNAEVETLNSLQERINMLKEQNLYKIVWRQS